MTSSNTLKKLVSIGAAILIAFGGSTVASQPALATVGDKTGVSLAGGNAHIRDGMTSISLEITGCGGYTGTANLSDFALTVTGGSQTITRIDVLGYLVFNFSSALTAGETVTITYTQNVSRFIQCGLGGQVGSFAFTDTIPLPPSITGTPTISASGATIVASPAQSVGGTTTNYWFLCTGTKVAASATLMGAPIDGVPGCLMLFTTAASSSPASGNRFDLNGTYYTRSGSMGQYTYPAAVLTGKTIVFAQALGMAIAYSASLSTTVGTVTTTDSTDVVDTPITEDKRPLPVWASNVIKSIPTLTKSLAPVGGAVSLTSGDYADLLSVTIGGKAATFKVETNGNVSIPVPAGEAGKTADIVVVFAGGKLTVQDGIKYVAPTDVTKVAERPVSIAAGSKKITEAIADQIRQAAFANMTNTNIQCVAYSANNSAKAKAAAELTAVQACGIAAKANPALKIADVTVIVDKAKARKAAVGIKVYKN